MEAGVRVSADNADGCVWDEMGNGARFWDSLLQESMFDKAEVAYCGSQQ